MTSAEPRLPPLDEGVWDDELREMLGKTARDGRVFNVFTTLARHPKLLKRWMVFANHVLFKSSLPPRDRELLILRVAHLCRSQYEWGQHRPIARDCGLTDDEIARVADGPDAPGWDPFEAALLRAADELHTDACLSDATWKKLAERYDEHRLMDAVFTVGNYTLLAMALNSFGVRLDPGLAA